MHPGMHMLIFKYPKMNGNEIINDKKKIICAKLNALYFYLSYSNTIILLEIFPLIGLMSQKN